MLFRYFPRPIQRGIDLFFTVLLICLAVAFLNTMSPEKASKAEHTAQLQHDAMQETGLRCVRVILAEPGRIDCFDGRGSVVLTHTDSTGWIEQ